jgi:chromate transporter
MLWQLFVTFLKIGFISFGGGYAMIPVIEHEVYARNWMQEKDFLDAVSVAGMSPGPIATNCATLIGYKTAGLSGAIAATLGMIIPSLIIIVLIAAFFYKIHRHKSIQSMFYGLRPIVTGLMVYAAIHFAEGSAGLHAGPWEAILTIAIVIFSVLGLLRFRMHPLVVMILAGTAGIAVFH